VQGDWGYSLARPNQAIISLVGECLWNTMWLAFITASEDAIMFGVVAGLYRDHVPDVVISVIVLVGMSLPEFVIGLLLMLVFGVMWAILPAITIVPPNISFGQLLPNYGSGSAESDYAWL
jgi:peptide/nickel transport system permease protein